MSSARLHPAGPADCDFVWRLNNAPEVRAASRSTEPIPWADHVAWFDRSLSSDARALYIAVDGGERMGVLRWDAQLGDEDCEISITLQSASRGKGLGTRLLTLLCQRIAAERPCAKRALATIRHDNMASARAFARAGFTQLGADTDGVWTWWEKPL